MTKLICDRSIQLALFLSVAVFSSVLGDTRTDDAIVAAAKSYTAAHSEVQEFHVAVEKIEGDYARARIFPNHGQTDAAWLFLKREKGRWIGLTLGTGIEPRDYKRLHIPEGLWVR